MADRNTDPRNVGILIFDDVEVLDFAGPFEVFNVSGEMITPRPFNTYTVALTPEPIRARGGLRVTPHYSADNCPPLDILLVPGGWGTRSLLDDQPTLDWIAAQAEQVELLLSVCTGSLLLGKLGLLDGLRATTHHTAFELLRELAPDTTVVEDERFIDNGTLITSGGISAGIDMALHVVKRLVGPEKQALTVKEMEYGWHLKR